MPKNRQVLLDNRPQGEASASNFRLVTTDTPPLQDKQVLSAPEAFLGLLKGRHFGKRLVKLA